MNSFLKKQWFNLKMRVYVVWKLRVFVNRCLRSIFKIRWPKVICKNECKEIAGHEDIAVGIAIRKWRWIGHMVRKDHHGIARERIFRTADVKRIKGRSKTKWWRITGSKLKRLSYREKLWWQMQRIGLGGKIVWLPYVPPGKERPKWVRTIWRLKTRMWVIGKSIHIYLQANTIITGPPFG